MQMPEKLCLSATGCWQLVIMLLSSRSLDGKMEKRRAELKRAETRLSSLAAVRPAYMDELEGLQANLQQLFAVYLQKHRSGVNAPAGFLQIRRFVLLCVLRTRTSSNRDAQE